MCSVQIDPLPNKRGVETRMPICSLKKTPFVSAATAWWRNRFYLVYRNPRALSMFRSNDSWVNLASRSPADRLPAILFIEPFLKGREVIADRRGVHLALARELE